MSATVAHPAFTANPQTASRLRRRRKRVNVVVAALCLLATAVALIFLLSILISLLVWVSPASRSTYSPA